MNEPRVVLHVPSVREIKIIERFELILERGNNGGDESNIRCTK